MLQTAEREIGIGGEKALPIVVRSSLNDRTMCDPTSDFSNSAPASELSRL